MLLDFLGKFKAKHKNLYSKLTVSYNCVESYSSDTDTKETQRRRVILVFPETKQKKKKEGKKNTMGNEGVVLKRHWRLRIWFRLVGAAHNVLLQLSHAACSSLQNLCVLQQVVQKQREVREVCVGLVDLE